MSPSPDPPLSQEEGAAPYVDVEASREITSDAGRFKPDEHFPIDATLLPAGWAVVPLGAVVSDVRQGFANGEHNTAGHGVPHLRPMNINRRGRIALAQLKYVEAPSGLRVVRDDVLFNNTNSADLVGKTARFDENGEWGFSNHITRLRPPEGLLPEFLAYQLHMLWEQGYFRLRRTQHVNQASISARTLTSSVPLVLAPAAEQRSVVEALKRTLAAFDTVEAAADRARERLDRYRRNVIAAAAEGRLALAEPGLAKGGADEGDGHALLARLRAEHGGSRGPGSAKANTLGRDADAKGPSQAMGVPELPRGWARATVEEVGEVLLGRQRAPRHHQGLNMRPYLRVANVLEDRIDTSDVHSMNFTPAEYETYALRSGDILLNEGQSPELVGRPALYRGEVPGACFQKTLLRFRAHRGVSPGFALLVFRAYLHGGQFRAIAKWTTNIAHLTRERFVAMPFPLPSLAEQERIAAEAERRLMAADDLARTVAAIAERTVAARLLARRQAFAGVLVPSSAPPGAALELLAGIQGSAAQRSAPYNQPEARPMSNPKRGQRRTARKTIVEVLRSNGAPMPPEEVLTEAGIGEDLVDEFYTELKRAVLGGTVREDRDINGDPLLVAVGSADAP